MFRKNRAGAGRQQKSGPKRGKFAFPSVLNIRNMFAPVKVEQTVIVGRTSAPGAAGIDTDEGVGPAKPSIAGEDLAVLAKNAKQEAGPAHAADAYDDTATRNDPPEPVLKWLEPLPSDGVDKRV